MGHFKSQRAILRRFRLLVFDQSVTENGTVAFGASLPTKIFPLLISSLLVRGREVFINARIDIVMGSKAYQTPSNLLRDADIALYQAKARGHNRYVVFTEEMHIQARQRM
ncbi:MAG TPA: diguanylate cyclase [Trichocoleus sp.]